MVRRERATLERVQLIAHGLQAGRIEAVDAFFYSSRRRHTRLTCDWSSDVCSSDLLDAHRDHLQRVKEVVGELKARGHEAYKLHKTVSRPWGTYTVLEEGRGFKIKRIEVRPGAALSLQLHHRRSEHWVVVQGTARVTCGDDVFDIGANQSTFIPVETRHRLENPGTEP